MPPFHLAFPVHDLAAARAFYGCLLGCPEGRSSEHWVDFDFFGHQIVAHLAPDQCNVSEGESPQLVSCAEGAEPASAARPKSVSAAANSSLEHDPSRRAQAQSGDQTNKVDGKSVPVCHFGLVLDMPTWRDLADKLNGKVEFLIAPYTRFEGQPGEQATMFFSDPSGNAIELKAFADRTQLFAK
ncbi:MAG: VOC family protein [Henriciella sp.]|nr:VOC family protein [Henriciella sp.]